MCQAGITFIILLFYFLLFLFLKILRVELWSSDVTDDMDILEICAILCNLDTDLRIHII